MSSNEQLKMLSSKLCDDLFPGSMEELELDRRLNDVKTNLGLLDQMLKLPGGGSKLHKLIIIRSIVSDLFGVRGESFNIR